MRVVVKTLARGNEGCWRVVFDREELHLYVGFIEDNVPVAGMTVEDFLVIIPSTALHREAHQSFIQLLHELFATC